MRFLLPFLLFASGLSAQTLSVWSTSTTPANLAAADSGSVELGMRFTSSVAGTVTGLRFYKSATNLGTHTGNLWDSAGNNLATGTFVNESASGWQSLQFTAPVAITPNAVYTVSYHAPQGQYSYDHQFFAAPLVVTPLTALNGYLTYGTGQFPTTNYGTNYWVDVLFVPTVALPPQPFVYTLPGLGTATFSMNLPPTCGPTDTACSIQIQVVMPVASSTCTTDSNGFTTCTGGVGALYLVKSYTAADGTTQTLTVPVVAVSSP